MTGQPDDGSSSKDITNELGQLVNSALAGNVYKLPKNKVRSSQKSSIGNVKGKAIPKQQEEQQQEVKKISYVQKYYSAKEGVLAEAVLIGGKPYFVVSRAQNPSYIEIPSSLELANEVLKPTEPLSYINLPYKFDSQEQLINFIERAKQETLDSLYRKNKAIWCKYIDGDDFHISIAAADEIYSYFQDKIGLTHYLFFTGGNNSGKSNNLTKIHYTAYRNMMSTDVTAANIYQFLGSREDEGHGTL